MLQFSFHDWLMAREEIAQAVEWHFPESGPLAYPHWPHEYQIALEEAFWRGQQLAIADPPPNILSLSDDDKPLTTLSPEDAWDLYRVTAGHVLAAEFARLFPWSLEDYTYNELIVLLSGRWIFTWYSNEGGYRVVEGGTPILPSPPKIVYPFLVDNDLIAGTRFESIVRLTEWCRQNLHHLFGDDTVKNFEYNWQYRGCPPVSRIIARTPNTNTDPAYGDSCVYSRTPGCWGTTGFFMSVLRLANIPVKLQPYVFGDLSHAAPYFPTEDRWLSHGDDPYNPNAFSTPSFSAAELLIDRPTFDSYFGSNIPDVQRQKNIGRRVGYDMVLQHWPNYTLRKYCDDLAAGHIGSDSEVFQSLSRYEVIDTATWNTYRSQMQQKIDELGGCDAIPETWKTYEGLCN
jgi:hypothetical protein